MDNNIMRPNDENHENEKFDTPNQSNESEATEVHGETFVMRNSEETVDSNSSEGETTIEYSSPTENIVNTSSHYNYMRNRNNSTTYNDVPPKKEKKKSSGFKRVMSYVLVGVLCTTIGGAASGAAILYGLPKTDMFKNTALYKSISNGVNTTASAYDNHPTQLAAETGAMTVSDIAKKVGPAVVAVTTTISGQQDFFGRQGVPQQGVGSGMIINQDGYVLTNYHVVEGAQQVKVVLSNGKQANAKVVNYDANYDVAVVKITDKVDIPAVVDLGDSNSLQVGESVVAIGNPLGTDFFGSVTTGIVSALNRKINGDNNKATYIQTDAAINSGNSGGPLINSRGQVVGINTAKIKESGVEGLGFAIPINAIKDKIPNLSKPILLIGIQGREIDSSISKQYNMPIGLYVQQVTEFSPAEKAGIKPGDVVTKFDGQKVATFDDVNNIKSKHKAGDEVSVTINRDGKDQTLSLKLTDQQ